MLLQNFQMCFDDGFFFLQLAMSSLSQIGGTDPDRGSEAPFLATHWTIEDTWIS